MSKSLAIGHECCSNHLKQMSFLCVYELKYHNYLYLIETVTHS